MVYRTTPSIRLYLEYGAGGSTYLAAKLGKRFVTIDSDKYFLKAVEDKITSDGFRRQAEQQFVHANIGVTTVWGNPLRIGKPSQHRLALYARYSDYPVSLLGDKTPDLILVDGRFRVACALKAIQALKNKDNWVLVIDDYVGRAYYEIVEKFAKVDRIMGRMIVFKGALEFSETSLLSELSRYQHDHR